MCCIGYAGGGRGSQGPHAWQQKFMCAIFTQGHIGHAACTTPGELGSATCISCLSYSTFILHRQEDGGQQLPVPQALQQVAAEVVAGALGVQQEQVGMMWMWGSHSAAPSGY